VRHAVYALSLFGILAASQSVSGAEPIPAPRPVGKPGEEVAGQRLTLSAPTRLRFGQHLDAHLSARHDTTSPPYLRMVCKGPFRTVFLELTTDRGEVVPFLPEGGFSGGTLEGEFAGFRLRPTGPHARGVYLAPGKYRLRALIDARKDPFDPNRWLGRIEAKPITLTVTEGVAAPLKPEEARKLIADLTAKDPKIRLKAVRRVPPTSNEEVLAALVGTLADPHTAPGFGFGETPPRHPVADAALSDSLPGQGPAAIGPLLDFAGREANASYRKLVAAVLGKLGPDKRSFEFLHALVEKGSHHERCLAVQACGQLGPEAIPELLRVARDGKQHAVVRRLAIEETANSGTAESVGAFLREALRYEEDQHRRAAARAIEAVEFRGALPDLRRLAEDEREEQNVRSDALRAFVVLAERGDARELVWKLLDSPDPSTRWRAEMILGGLGDTGDVPRLLERLSDKDRAVRARADSVLRLIAEKRTGVGYDPAKPDPELWQRWWKERR
jgi:HEAT repeat protein